MVAPHAEKPDFGAALPTWKLEDAKARLSELVRTARETGPQRVTVRGEGAVIVISIDEFARLSPGAAAPTLLDLFAKEPFTKLDNFDESIVREAGVWREPEF